MLGATPRQQLHQGQLQQVVKPRLSRVQRGKDRMKRAGRAGIGSERRWIGQRRGKGPGWTLFCLVYSEYDHLVCDDCCMSCHAAAACATAIHQESV